MPAMLWFERHVVAALVSDLDQAHQAAVTDYVDGSLRAMPEHLRAGVVGESLLFGGWSKARRALSQAPQDATAELKSLEESPIGLVRQYVRLLQSLVLFATYELSSERSW